MSSPRAIYLDHNATTAPHPDVVTAVEAALFETGSRFDLNGRTLKELDAAGVPDGVVDVMVAQSFPGHVAIGRQFSR